MKFIMIALTYIYILIIDNIVAEFRGNLKSFLEQLLLSWAVQDWLKELEKRNGKREIPITSLGEFDLDA